jgi:hypothetical protein
MALFGGQRDMSLFRTLNKELINDIIDTEVYYFKLVVDESNVNLYGEGSKKVYYNPVKIPCLIEYGSREAVSDDFGQYYTRTAEFRFLRDSLKDDKDIFPEIGDIVEWNNEYFMIDNVASSQFFAGKNPDTWDGGEEQGYNLSVVCSAHMTRQTTLNLVDSRFGNSNNTTNTIPAGI